MNYIILYFGGNSVRPNGGGRKLRVYPSMPDGAKFATGVTSGAAPYGYRAIQFGSEKNFEVGLVKDPDVSDAERAESVRARRMNLNNASIDRLENLMNNAISGGPMSGKVQQEARERLRKASDRYENDIEQRRRLRALTKR